ncbi:hypothetical protein DFA_02822 [Cavenderia fasciculata]|uniref:Uncharacterized protein n=1 Tax=Cavenderia fasciculata TaxID=261658 RepID=F4PIJ9_CACFS|nr:uncharacterized protein DFA_02822 [Cavenderia fasciculata]EGG24579.1 hypothetical protein DFA_02822 [Cavenderia fasciculata]|eukprot:XP_004362430.1 hypothetical protein DFA_02822 [Cavenderia fasciculata]
MSDEPINSKQLARGLHKASRHVDKNTSKGKYKKQERLVKEQQVKQQAELEQTEEYQMVQPRSKYSKRVIQQQSRSTIEELDRMNHTAERLNMQDLLDSSVDFIPSLSSKDNTTSYVQDYDEDGDDELSKDIDTFLNINMGEIEKMILTIPMPKRLDIDIDYFVCRTTTKNKKPTPVTLLSRKSNRHLRSAGSSLQQPQQQQNINVSKPSSPSSTTNTQKPVPIPVSTLTTKENNNNNNKESNSVQDSSNQDESKDGLQDWLDTII